MFFKLAISNVKKSIKDYLVYFLTLSLSVCIFYIFNAIDSQEVMLNISSSQKEILELLSVSIGYVSIFISVVLGFLMVYANKFLIKRRKKELGLYLTLGMNRGTVSRMLILETFIIGLFSLGTGLLVGIFASQALSVVTAKLFEANLKAFVFIFSKGAFLKTICYFSIIYIIIMIFNTMTISKCKLIELIYSGKKNERLRVKRIGVSVILFILAVMSLGVAYYLILENGLMRINKQFICSIVLGIVGTLLFFVSLGGFLIRLVETSKSVYFKGLNLFVLRQLNHKINTAFVSMSVICIMLFLTIAGLASGFSVARAFNGELETLTPFDATFEAYSAYKGELGLKEGIQASLEKTGFPFKELVKESSELILYRTEVTWEDLLGDIEELAAMEAWEYTKEQPFYVMSATDYNKALEMQGLSPIELKEDEFVMNCNYGQTKPYLKQFLINKGQLTMNGKLLKAATKEVLTTTYENQNMAMNVGTLIVPDQFVEGGDIYIRILNVNYPGNTQEQEKLFNTAIYKLYPTSEGRPYSLLMTRIGIYENSAGLSAMVTYLTIYIGMVFLLACAAILALQQLSEAADNSERYELLRKLGAEEGMVNKALFMQISIYFIMPLVLAVIHSIVGLKVGSDVISIFGGYELTNNLFLAAAVILVVYGGYFIATYMSSKNIIRAKR
ncbi:FtsX-like permease family protein [Cellulosilyticum sp. WCF-2]|uniref:FtsX-like permease family protein n=1 Tax=Cellulosilyticum sp. WCF-2 TaxID=2497860 RepID=UPI000F8D88DA|nr:ABC transporter permease [Cellulosilyticum sp. WCF-2]QEH68764.1 ABC transporter permease [Cellulosilyticum sp. WCF-2]